MVRTERFILSLKKYWKTFIYEFRYWWLKTRPLSIIRFLLYITCLIVVSYNDTYSFFAGADSPIPSGWKTSANKYHFAGVTIVVILTLTIIERIGDWRKRNEFIEIMTEYIPPSLNRELDNLLSSLVQEFGLSCGARATIFVPGRMGFFSWRLRMACWSSVVPTSEQEAHFDFDEGAIGYTFLKTKRHRVEVVPITNIENEKKYNDLSYENKVLIRNDIKCILVVSVFQNGQIAGLVTIDSSDVGDIIKMEKQEVHSDIFGWLFERQRDIKLLWRLQNHV